MTVTTQPFSSGQSNGQQQPASRSLSRAPSVRRGSRDECTAPPQPLEWVATSTYLEAELASARSAVAALDALYPRLSSFKGPALDLLEEAERALVRLEQAAARAKDFPELAVLACELKLNAKRGEHLMHVYGSYKYFGKIIAAALRRKATAKFSKVVERLKQVPWQPGPLSQPGYPFPAAVTGSSSIPASSPVYSRQLSQVDSDHLPASPGAGHVSRRASSSGTALAALEQGLGLLGLHKPHHGAAGKLHVRTRALVLRQFVRSKGHDEVHCITLVPLAREPDSISSPHSRTSSCGGSPVSGWQLAPPAAPGASSSSSGSIAHITLWWSVGQSLEFYSGATQCIASFPVDDARKCVTSVKVDRAGSVWCGTSKGLLLVRKRHCWDQAQEAALFATAVRCIEFDADSDVAWVGDEGGCLKAVRCDWEGGSLEVTGVMLKGRAPFKAGASIANLGPRINKSFKRLQTMNRTRSTPLTETIISSEVYLEGPIQVAVVRNDRAWVGGGRTAPWLTLFDAVAGGQLSTWDCSSVGACHAMAVLPSPISPAIRRLSRLDSSRPGAGSAFSSSPWAVAALALPAMVPEDGHVEPRSCWKLLTGHEQGQVLMWSAATDHLSPLARLGDPAGSPVRALGVHEDHGLISQVLASGELHVFLRPSEEVEWATVTLGAGKISTLRPRKVTLAAHRSGTIAAFATSNVVVTASLMGTIKLWTAEALAAEAAAHGLVTIQARSRRISLVSEPGIRPQSPLATAARSLEPPCSPSSTGAAAAAVAGGTGPGSSTPTGRHLRFSDSPIPAYDGGSHLAHAADGSKARQAGHPAAAAAPTVAGCTAAAAAAVISTLRRASQQRQAEQQQQQQQHEHEAQTSSARGTPVHHGEPAATTPQQRRKSTPRSSLTEALTSEGLSMQQQQPLRQQESRQWSKSDSSKSLVDMEGSRRVSSFGAPLPAYGSEAALAAAAVAAASVGNPSSWHAGSSSSMALGSGGGGASSGQQGSRCHTPRASSLNSPMPVTPVGVSERSPVSSATPDAHGSSTEPRKPRHQCLAEASADRTRRKSERRLSRGANIAWSTCQVIQSEELKLLHIIGTGAYGKVWKADWAGTEVAVKELLSIKERAHGRAAQRHKERQQQRQQEAAAALSTGSGSDTGSIADDAEDSDTDSVDSVEEEVNEELKTLMDEVYLLGSLSHPNIMRFCAVCLDPPMIVTQYYPHGSMFDLLKRARRGEKRAVQELTWSKRLDMLRDVAAGMLFLHNRRPSVIHGDLRSPNLLLDLTFDGHRPRFHVRIADFGLARMLGPDSSIAVSKVTNPRWSAPEVIRSSVVSKSADVFSFGVVMWEMLTWEQPYEDMMSIQVLFSVPHNMRPELPSDGELPGHPPAEALEPYKELMQRCWSGDPAERPTFDGVVAELDAMRGKEAVRRLEAGSRCSTPGSRVTLAPGASMTLAPGASMSPQNSPTYSHGGSYTGEDPLAHFHHNHHHSGSTWGGSPFQSGGRTSMPGMSSPGRFGGPGWGAEPMGYTDSGAFSSGMSVTAAGAAATMASEAPRGAGMLLQQHQHQHQAYAAAAAAAAAGGGGMAGPGSHLAGQMIHPGLISPYSLPAIRTTAQSDPGCPVSVPLGDKRLPLAGVGSGPALSGATATSGGLTQQTGSGALPPAVQCEVAFGSNLDHLWQGSLSPPQQGHGAGPPGSAHLLPSGALGLFGGHPPVTRTPSRLGPSRTNSNITTAAAGAVAAAYAGLGSAALSMAASVAGSSTGNSPRLLTSGSFGGALPSGTSGFGAGVGAAGAGYSLAQQPGSGSWDGRHVGGYGQLARQHSGAHLGYQNSHLSRTLSSPRGSMATGGAQALASPGVSSPGMSPAPSPRYSLGAAFNPFAAAQGLAAGTTTTTAAAAGSAAEGEAGGSAFSGADAGAEMDAESDPSSATAAAAAGGQPVGFHYPPSQTPQQPQTGSVSGATEDGGMLEPPSPPTAAAAVPATAATGTISTPGTWVANSPFAAAQTASELPQQQLAAAAVAAVAGHEDCRIASSTMPGSDPSSTSSSSSTGRAAGCNLKPPSISNLPASPFALAQTSVDQLSLEPGLVKQLDQQALTAADLDESAEGERGRGHSSRPVWVSGAGSNSSSTAINARPQSRPTSPFAQAQPPDGSDFTSSPPAVARGLKPRDSDDAAAVPSSSGSSSTSGAGGRSSRNAIRPSSCPSPPLRNSFETATSPFAAIQAPCFAGAQQGDAAQGWDGSGNSSSTGGSALDQMVQQVAAGPGGTPVSPRGGSSHTAQEVQCTSAGRPTSPFSAPAVQGSSPRGTQAAAISSGSSSSNSRQPQAALVIPAPVSPRAAQGSMSSTTGSSPPGWPRPPSSPFAAASSQVATTSDGAPDSDSPGTGDDLRCTSPFAAAAAAVVVVVATAAAAAPAVLPRQVLAAGRPGTPMSTYASAESHLSAPDGGVASPVHHLNQHPNHLPWPLQQQQQQQQQQRGQCLPTTAAAGAEAQQELPSGQLTQPGDATATVAVVAQPGPKVGSGSPGRGYIMQLPSLASMAGQGGRASSAPTTTASPSHQAADVGREVPLPPSDSVTFPQLQQP